MKFFNNIKKKIRYVLQVKKLQKKEVFLDKDVKIRKTEFEGKNTIGDNTNIDRSYIGLGSYIGSDCKLPSCKIGRFCSIGVRVLAVIGDHPIEYVSTHPFSHSRAKKNIGFNYENIVEKEGLKRVDEEYIIEIGNDVWIGDGVQILNGVRIGDGAVIGAGALVTKDVEPYSIIGGVPGKVLKKRFSEENIKKLLDFKWWNKDISWIEKNAYYFHDIKKFMEIIENEK
ncbi:CatB-related O-acetyltransferase [Cetobacterium sp. NK01]|uniref:CatB-related O-acetyltransferase n=1 Tax=Cetobacterium sp. NK01 TaxID=2993530 RepID=UPI0039B6EE18